MSFEDDEYWDEEYSDHSPVSYADNTAVAEDRYSARRIAPDPVLPTRRPAGQENRRPARPPAWEDEDAGPDVDELAARRQRRENGYQRSATRDRRIQSAFDGERPGWLDDPDFVPHDLTSDPDDDGVVDVNRPELGADFDSPDYRAPDAPRRVPVRDEWSAPQPTAPRPGRSTGSPGADSPAARGRRSATGRAPAPASSPPAAGRAPAASAGRAPAAGPAPAAGRPFPADPEAARWETVEREQAFQRHRDPRVAFTDLDDEHAIIDLDPAEAVIDLDAPGAGVIDLDRGRRKRRGRKNADGSPPNSPGSYSGPPAPARRPSPAPSSSAPPLSAPPNSGAPAAGPPSSAPPSSGPPFSAPPFPGSPAAGPPSFAPPSSAPPSSAPPTSGRPAAAPSSSAAPAAAVPPSSAPPLSGPADGRGRRPAPGFPAAADGRSGPGSRGYPAGGDRPLREDRVSFERPPDPRRDLGRTAIVWEDGTEEGSIRPPGGRRRRPAEAQPWPDQRFDTAPPAGARPWPDQRFDTAPAAEAQPWQRTFDAAPPAADGQPWAADAQPWSDRVIDSTPAPGPQPWSGPVFDATPDPVAGRARVPEPPVHDPLDVYRPPRRPARPADDQRRDAPAAFHDLRPGADGRTADGESGPIQPGRVDPRFPQQPARDRRGHEPAGFDRGRQEPAAFDRGGHEPATFDRGQQEATGFDRHAAETGAPDRPGRDGNEQGTTQADAPRVISRTPPPPAPRVISKAAPPAPPKVIKKADPPAIPKVVETPAPATPPRVVTPAPPPVPAAGSPGGATPDRAAAALGQQPGTAGTPTAPGPQGRPDAPGIPAQRPAAPPSPEMPVPPQGRPGGPGAPRHAGPPPAESAPAAPGQVPPAAAHAAAPAQPRPQVPPPSARPAAAHPASPEQPRPRVAAPPAAHAVAPEDLRAPVLPQVPPAGPAQPVPAPRTPVTPDRMPPAGPRADAPGAVPPAAPAGAEPAHPAADVPTPPQGLPVIGRPPAAEPPRLPGPRDARAVPPVAEPPRVHPRVEPTPINGARPRTVDTPAPARGPDQPPAAAHPPAPARPGTGPTVPMRHGTPGPPPPPPLPQSRAVAPPTPSPARPPAAPRPRPVDPAPAAPPANAPKAGGTPAAGAPPANPSQRTTGPVPDPNPVPIGRLTVSGPDGPRRYPDADLGGSWFAKPARAAAETPQPEAPATDEDAAKGAAPDGGMVLSFDITGLVNGTGEQPATTPTDEPAEEGRTNGGRETAGREETGREARPEVRAESGPATAGPASRTPTAADLAAIRWRLDGGTLREVVDDRDALRELGERLDEPIADETDHAARAGLLSVRAEVYRLLGELGMAAAASRLALVHAETAGDPQATVIAQAELAHVLRLRGDFAEADRLFEEAASSEAPAELRSVVHENAGRCCFDQGRHMEALDHFGRAVRLGREDDTDLAERIEVSLEAVYIHVLRDGWGPYPRQRREIIGSRRPDPAGAEPA